MASINKYAYTLENCVNQIFFLSFVCLVFEIKIVERKKEKKRTKVNIQLLSKSKQQLTARKTRGPVSHAYRFGLTLASMRCTVDLIITPTVMICFIYDS